MHLECLAYIGPVITRRLGLEDWPTRRRTGRSRRWTGVFRGRFRGHGLVVTERS